MTSKAHGVVMMLAFTKSVDPLVTKLHSLLAEVTYFEALFLCYVLVFSQSSFCNGNISSFCGRLDLIFLVHIIEHSFLKLRCIYFLFFVVISDKKASKEDKAG